MYHGPPSVGRHDGVVQRQSFNCCYDQKGNPNISHPCLLQPATCHTPQQLSLACTPTTVLNKFYLPKCRCPAACMGSLRSGSCRSMSELQLRKTWNKEPLDTEQHVSNTLWPTGLQVVAQRTPMGVFADRKDKLRPGQELWSAVCMEGMRHNLDKVDCRRIVDENRKWM